jgi:hypothetical protein
MYTPTGHTGYGNGYGAWNGSRKTRDMNNQSMCYCINPKKYMDMATGHNMRLNNTYIVIHNQTG